MYCPRSTRAGRGWGWPRKGKGCGSSAMRSSSFSEVVLFSDAETAACRRLVAWALEEDLGTAGDLTSQAVVPADLPGRAVFVARAAGVVAGLPAASLVLAAVDARLSLQPLLADGMRVQSGTQLAMVAG